MTRKLILFPILLLALVLSACGANASAPLSTDVPSNAQYTSPNLDTTYENALPVRLQLTLGTLMLDGTPQAITPEQARELLPLYQALQALTASGTAAEAETNAVLAQIEATFTTEQLAAIRAMQLTTPKMQEWAAQNGLTLGSGTGAGKGQGSGMSPEARATRQAEEGKTPSETGASNGASAALTKAVIDYLQKIQP
ncbi:MAG: hypothetical protein WHV44_08750 [Anaerolineales bacterium]